MKLKDFLRYEWRVLKGSPKCIKTHLKNKIIDKSLYKFYSDEQVVSMIINENKSLARFGDGEFSWMVGDSIDSFQNTSEFLTKRLIQVAQSNNESLLIAIPKGVIDASACNRLAKMGWVYARKNFYRLTSVFDGRRIYADASITRPYIDYKNKKKSKDKFINLKRIWNNRNILIVEGTGTKLGLGNDLFDNAKSLRRILCPSQNAFEKIDDIESAIIKNVCRDEMILVALGPSATIIASDLCDKGYQVIDIGHIDIEYMWYLNKSVLRDSIRGKSVNESGNRNYSDYYENDEKYKKSIIEMII